MKKQLDCNALRQGFSLVELSIVLVIIGLLVGGVASLRTYVRSAQTSNLMNESKFYISAFNQFQTRYNAPPGDYNTASSAWTGAGNGDGNGLIRATGTAPGNTAESYYAFQHLALGGLIRGTYTGAVNGAGGATAGLNVPTTTIENGAYLFDHPDATDGIVLAGDSYYYAGTYGNVLIVAGLNANSASTPSQALLSVKQAYQLDDKYDDGVANTGNIVMPVNAVLPNCTSSLSGAYAFPGTDERACSLILKMQ